MNSELDMADLVIGRQQRRITQLERMVEHLAEQVAGYQQQEAERVAAEIGTGPELGGVPDPAADAAEA